VLFRSGEDDVFFVEKILRMKTVKGKRVFYIKWKGFPDSDNTWEPEEHLDCEEILAQFLKGNQATHSSKRKSSDVIKPSSAKKKTKSTNDSSRRSLSTVQPVSNPTSPSTVQPKRKSTSPIKTSLKKEGYCKAHAN